MYAAEHEDGAADRESSQGRKSGGNHQQANHAPTDANTGQDFRPNACACADWLSDKVQAAAAMAKKYPVLAYVLFCGVFALLAFGTFSLGSYDDGGIGLVGMLLIIVWSIIAFPFSIPMQLAGPGLGMAVGLLLCAVGEIVIQLVRMRRG